MLTLIDLVVKHRTEGQKPQPLPLRGRALFLRTTQREAGGGDLFCLARSIVVPHLADVGEEKFAILEDGLLIPSDTMSQEGGQGGERSCSCVVLQYQKGRAIARAQPPVNLFIFYLLTLFLNSH